REYGESALRWRCPSGGTACNPSLSPLLIARGSLGSRLCLGEVAECGLDCRSVNVLRIEIAEPSPKFGTPLVRRVRDGVQDFSISPRTSAVFGRAATLGVNQLRELFPEVRRKSPLDLDRVSPVVAEIVIVAQRLEVRFGKCLRDRRPHRI